MPPTPPQSTHCARNPASRPSSSRPLVPPLELSAVFCPDDLDHVDALSTGEADGFIYARDGHPNARQLSEKLATLEAAETGLICASGMGAIAAGLLSILSQGDHLLVAEGIYGKTSALVTRQLTRWGITSDIFDPADPQSARNRLLPSTRLILAETISNPLLRVADIPGLAAVAHDHGIPLMIDNTFAPLICRPITQGADLVAHSVTKMIGGHSDLTLGALLGASRWLTPASTLASTLGQTGNPFESWLALRGLATLPLRMTRSSTTALALARKLADHKEVQRTIYPGLSTHRDHALATKILDLGFGPMLTIDLETRTRAQAFIRSLPNIPFAPSLGDVQTTLSHPYTTSHRGQDPQTLESLGITPGMIRLSIGLEDEADLWQELDQALGETSLVS